MGNGKGKKHRIPAVEDMIVPFSVFIWDGQYIPVENRADHYLIKQFQFYYKGSLNENIWNTWVDLINRIYIPAASAFQGEINLHQREGEIHKISEVYKNLWR